MASCLKATFHFGDYFIGVFKIWFKHFLFPSLEEEIAAIAFGKFAMTL
jgi:hypothetical protein